MLFYFYLERNKQRKSPDSLLAFNQKLKSYLNINRKKKNNFFFHKPQLSLVPTSTCIILSLDLHLEENIHYWKNGWQQKKKEEEKADSILNSVTHLFHKLYGENGARIWHRLYTLYRLYFYKGFFCSLSHLEWIAGKKNCRSFMVFFSMCPASVFPTWKTHDFVLNDRKGLKE